MKKQHVHVVNAAILRDGECLVAQRGPGMSFSDKWELPGGKVEPGERPREALRREVKEELGIDVEVGALIARAESRPGSRTFCVDVFEARVAHGTPTLEEHSQHRWFDARTLDDLDWVEPHRPLLPAVKDYLKRKRSVALNPWDPAAVVVRGLRASETAFEWVAISMAWSMAAFGTWSALVAAGLGSRRRGTVRETAVSGGTAPLSRSVPLGNRTER
jgi:8-oxo-dGTP diphosphatase